MASVDTMGCPQSLPANERVLVAEAGLRVCAFPLSEAEVNQNTALCSRVIQEIRRFDVAVEDPVRVNARESGEERAQIYGDIRNRHLTKVLSEIGMAEIREDSHDLVCMSESRDKWADRRTIPQVV